MRRLILLIPENEPIVIGTANSLTGVLAPYEQAINNGMDIAADEINAAGGVGGRKIKIIHVDAKSDLNLSATATLDVIEKGAQIVVPICDADYGAPGARAANEKGILAITCAGAPGIGRQTVGPLTFNAPISSAIAYWSTRRSYARRSRRAGRASAERSWARTPSSRATSRSRPR
jgi:branched-chain amino acid transport system substrate-binding protein